MLKISTLNVRGIRKMRSVTGLSSADFHRWIRFQTSGIFCLQELQFDPLLPIEPTTTSWLQTALGAHTAIWTPFCGILLKTPLSPFPTILFPRTTVLFLLPSNPQTLPLPLIFVVCMLLLKTTFVPPSFAPFFSSPF